jgi:hypothetical protein
MPLQPWISTDNPRAAVWCRELFRALDAGFIRPDEVEVEVARGHVRPSLLWQIAHRVEEPLLAPARVLEHDDSTFIPPYAGLVGLNAFKRRQQSLRARLRRRGQAGMARVRAAQRAAAGIAVSPSEIIRHWGRRLRLIGARFDA